MMIVKASKGWQVGTLQNEPRFCVVPSCILELREEPRFNHGRILFRFVQVRAERRNRNLNRLKFRMDFACNDIESPGFSWLFFPPGDRVFLPRQSARDDLQLQPRRTGDLCRGANGGGCQCRSATTIAPHILPLIYIRQLNIEERTGQAPT